VRGITGGEAMVLPDSLGLPFPDLLCPSWLLAGFDLTLLGPAIRLPRSAGTPECESGGASLTSW
jgi:hypothetical protein